MYEDDPQAHDGPDPASEAGAPGFLWVLVGLMSAIEITLMLSDAGFWGSSNWRWAAWALGAFWQPIWSGAITPVYPGQEVAMLMTYAFLHGGILHLVVNSVVLLSLGKHVADRIGAGRTLLVLFLSAVGGALAFGFISSATAPMIGASGAVFGLIGLWQAWDYKTRQRCGLPLRPVIVMVLALVVSNIVLAVFLTGGLAWETHLGGWLAGWLSGQSFARRTGHFQ